MTIEEIIIRRATKSDAAGMVAFTASLQAEQLDTVRKRAPTTEAFESSEIEEAEANGRAFFLIGEARNEIVAILGLWAGKGEHDRHSARFGLAVRKEWRRRGLGRRLIENAISEAKTWPHFCRIELECTLTNESAIRLYESLGFQREGVRRKSTDMGRGPQDMLLMSLVW
jgi:putative acetyltransferase